MKLSGFIMLVLMVGLAFAMIGGIVSDMQIYYPNVSVGTNFTKYDYKEEIASNQTVLQGLIESMNDEDTGWFKATLLGVAAVPVAMFKAITTLFKSLSLGVIILSSIGEDIGIPGFVINFAVVALTIAVTWGIISWWRNRSKV